MNEDLKNKIRTIPNWPRKGIMFRDITTLIKDKKAFMESCRRIAENYKEKDIDLIAGIESRGLIFGSALAILMNKGFILIRKKGKLPAETICQEYELEYGLDSIEIHKDSIKKGDKVLIVDDLLATGGTMKAACMLVEKCGGKVAGCTYVIELVDLHGNERLKEYELFHLVDFEGE